MLLGTRQDGVVCIGQDGVGSHSTTSTSIDQLPAQFLHLLQFKTHTTIRASTNLWRNHIAQTDRLAADREIMAGVVKASWTVGWARAQWRRSRTRSGTRALPLEPHAQVHAKAKVCGGVSQGKKQHPASAAAWNHTHTWVEFTNYISSMCFEVHKLHCLTSSALGSLCYFHGRFAVADL